jgi:hypothetical protein
VKLLLLGGYGGFGGRIAERLAKAGFDVLVAGRSLARASAFCSGRPGLHPLAADREDIAAILAEHRPWLVVDAAGPFQALDYRVAEAAIAAGCHYVDIADGRAFVTGIGRLDAAARAAGVAIVSGASSVPALSGAVARRLAEGLDDVRAVEIALSATSRGTSGRSVLLAILSYVGRPVRLWRDRRWMRGFGWQSLAGAHFQLRGLSPLRRRLVGLADVPDLDLLPRRLAGAPATSFRAGTDLGWHNLGLWLLSWPVRWRWLGGVQALASLLSAVQRLTRGLASQRSGMVVRLFGIAGAQRMERRWTLIAERGDGPEIPTLAVPLVVERAARGAIAPGAGDAGTLLDLGDFTPALAGLAVAAEVVERRLAPPLYARVIGPAFEALPPAVRRMHDVLRNDGAAGLAESRRGRGPAGLLAAAFGFPPSGEHRLHVGFDERDGREVWTREFGGHVFASTLSVHRGLLVERFGLIRFGFDLRASSAGLEMVLRRWWLGPIRLPLALAPRIEAREWDEAGRFRFTVDTSLPLLGRLFAYRGWLEQPPGPEPLDGSAVAA